MIESMNSIKSELSTIRQGQTEQQAEREQVLEGLKVVKAVAERMDWIEVQEKQEQRLALHDGAIKKNSLKTDEGEKRISKLEEKMQKIDENAVDMRQCNAVAKEVRELMKRENNIVLFNVKESTEGDDGEKQLADRRVMGEIFKELGLEGS